MFNLIKALITSGWISVCCAPSNGAGTGPPAPTFAVPESFPHQAHVFASLRGWGMVSVAPLGAGVLAA